MFEGIGKISVKNYMKISVKYYKQNNFTKSNISHQKGKNKRPPGIPYIHSFQGNDLSMKGILMTDDMITRFDGNNQGFF